MKKIYKIMIFLVLFQFSVVIVNALEVFPSENTFYSDAETRSIRELDSPTDALSYFFELPGIPGLSALQTTFTFGMLVILFLSIGAAIARATHSWSPVIVVIIATSFVPMLMKSLGFFNKMLYNWNNQALMYLGLTLGVGIIILVVITILETPTHGDV